MQSRPNPVRAPISPKLRGSPQPRRRGRTISSTATGCSGASRSPASRPPLSSEPFIRPTSPRSKLLGAPRNRSTAPRSWRPNLADRSTRIEKANITAAALAKALDRDHDTFEGAIALEDREKIEKFIAGLGYPVEFAHHLKPWFLAILTALPECEAEREALQLAGSRPVLGPDGERLRGEGHWARNAGRAAHRHRQHAHRRRRDAA